MYANVKQNKKRNKIYVYRVKKKQSLESKNWNALKTKHFWPKYSYLL